MNQINSSDIKAFTFFSVGIIGVYALRKWIKHINQDYTFWQTNKIRDASELQNLKQGQKGIFKVQTKQSQVFKIKWPLYLNEVFFFEESDESIIQIAHMRSDEFKKWKVKGEGNKTIQINGLGQVIGDIFDVKKIKHIDPDYVNYWQHKKTFTYYFQKLLQFLFSRKEESAVFHRKPFTLGPKIGQIINYVSLNKNSFLLLSCKYQDGKFRGCMVSPSLGQVLNYLSAQYFIGACLTGLCLMDIAYNLPSVIKFGKKIYKRLFQKLQSKSLFVLDEVSDQKTCIICYQKNRNVTIFNCGHLIMCYDCLKYYNQSHCPVCRQPIVDLKIVRSI